MYTSFARGAPYKICEGKKRPKFSAIFNNFWLWLQMSPEQINMSKSEKYFINYISSPIRRKKWWTLVHKPKTYRRACWPTQLDFFRETIFRPLGVLAPQIFTRPTSPINCISSRTWGAGRPQVGLCPIFLVLFIFYKQLFKGQMNGILETFCCK